MILVSTVKAPYDDDNPRNADNHRYNDEYPHQYISGSHKKQICSCNDDLNGHAAIHFDAPYFEFMISSATGQCSLVEQMNRQK